MTTPMTPERHPAPMPPTRGWHTPPAPESRPVADVMTAAPVAVPRDTTAAETAHLMRERDIGDVLVLDGDTLCGLVTDRDLALRVLACYRGPNTPVGDVCTAEPVTLTAEDDIGTAERLMRANSVRRLPVVDATGAPIGVVSLGDLSVLGDPGSVLGAISASGPTR